VVPVIEYHLGDDGFGFFFFCFVVTSVAAGKNNYISSS